MLQSMLDRTREARGSLQSIHTALQIVSRMLHIDPDERPTLNQVERDLGNAVSGVIG